jgi:hypothetical protein
MTVRKVVMVVMLIALGACRRESSTITGSYAGGVLSGTVSLQGIEGSTEGVEVSVRGTGMTTTLGADGRFAFASVPEHAILDFRRADGIEAQLQITAASSPVLIALGRGGASRVGGAGGNRGRDKREFEGIIRTAGTESIVVYTSHKEEVTIALTEETVIRRGNETLTAADLAVDMRVHVRARRTADGYVAQQIVVQEGEDGDDGEDDDDAEDDRPIVRQYEGTVVTASATEVVVDDSHRVQTAFVVTPETVIRKGNTTVAAADLEEGARVHVKAEVAADGTATAVEIIVQQPKKRK